MIKSEAFEFPFLADLPRKEKTKIASLWDRLRELSAVTKEKGMLIPVSFAATCLGVSRQRVDQLIAAGRFEVHVVGDHRYITEVSLLAFAATERPTGVRVSKSEIWKASVDWANSQVHSQKR